MPKDAQSVPSAACSLGPHAAAERRRRFEELCARALIAQTLTDTGLRLRFRRAAKVEEELRELAQLEAECCSFARFGVTGAGDAVQLEVSAPPDAVDTVRRLFGPAPKGRRVGDRPGQMEAVDRDERERPSQPAP